MLNRASTVCGSRARALKRNAFSGASGLTWPDAEGISVRAVTTNARRRSPRYLVCIGNSLRGDPVEVRGQGIGNGDSDDFGKFVRVARKNGRLHLRIELGAGLDRQGCFVRRFDLAAPVIE